MDFLVVSICALLLVAFLGMALLAAVRAIRRLRGWRRAVFLLGMYAFVNGALGFFGSVFAAAGGLDWLGSYEWPVGLATSVAVMPDGGYVVVADAGYRIQVYSPDLKFIRGWSTGADIGRLECGGADRVYAWRNRRRGVYVYDLSGRLLSQQVPESRGHQPSGVMIIPTPWYLWPVTHPLIGFACLLFGVIISAVADPKGVVAGRPGQRAGQARDSA